MPFHVIRNDITRVRADAIVNTANPYPQVGRGSDTAVYQAAGWKQLLEARKKIGEIARGEAAVTPAFALNARYIIHTVGPVWQGGSSGEEQVLRSCYRNSLRKAKELKCSSIAFPLISAGSYGLPAGKSLEIALAEFSAFLMNEDEEMDILMVVFDRHSAHLSAKLFPDMESYIDDHYAGERSREERGGHYGALRGDMLGADIRKERVHREPWDADVRSECAHREPWDAEDRSECVCLEQRDASAWQNAEDKSSVEDIDEWDIDAYDEENEDLTFGGMQEEIQLPMMRSISLAPEKKDSAEKLGLDLQRKDVVRQAVSGTVQKKRSLDEMLSQAGDTFQERLFRLIDERGLTNPQVYKRANLTKKLFSKINSNSDYHPTKATALSLAIALELNLDETRDLLARAGLALSPCSKQDIVVQYFIETEKYDIVALDYALSDLGLKTLGNYE